LLGGQQRIDRDRHDAGADRAPERDRIVDGIVRHQHEPVFRAQTQHRQAGGEAIREFLQLCIGQRARGIHERHFVAETARDIFVDEIGDGVVGPALQGVFNQGRRR